MLRHSKIPKFAFIGTSSSGKTTATYQTCAYLKERGIRVDGILQQDRRLPFSPDLLSTHAEAQYWFIFNMITTESYMSLSRGTDCLVSDRSVLDFYAYMKYQWPKDSHEAGDVVTLWLDTYHTLFYLPPRAYDNDGVRPSDEFRLGVDRTLKDLISVNSKKVKEIPDWLSAARTIAIETKRSVLGPKAHLTGSWFHGTEKKESDFDFVMSYEDWTLAKCKMGQQRDSFVMKSPEGVRATNKKWEDTIAYEFHSDDLNIGVQVHATEELLSRKLERQLKELLCNTT